MRVPYAADTLLEQVQAKYKSASFEPVDDPDGFDVNREIVFDKTSSKWLTKLLPFLDDPRIVGFGEENGQVKVLFSARTDADERTPFALEDAETVAAEES